MFLLMPVVIKSGLHLETLHGGGGGGGGRRHNLHPLYMYVYICIPRCRALRDLHNRGPKALRLCKSRSVLHRGM